MTKIELYTRPDCNYCDNLKQVMANQRLTWEEKEIGRDVTREQVFEAIQEPQDAKISLPVVIIDGNYIGGYAEAMKWIFPPLEINDG